MMLREMTILEEIVNFKKVNLLKSTRTCNDQKVLVGVFAKLSIFPSIKMTGQLTKSQPVCCDKRAGVKNVYVFR